MKKILITGANDAKAYLVSKLLGSDNQIVYADSECREIQLPVENSNTYAHELLSLCLSLHIEEIIPLREKEVLALSEAKILFQEYEIQILIPNLNQLKDLGNIAGAAFKEVRNLELFSRNLLEMGYPSKPVAIGSADGRGNLLRIDDSSPDKVNIWNLPKVVSFIQANKLLKGNQFETIRIYQLEEESIMDVDVLSIYGQVYIHQKLEDIHVNLIKEILESNDLKGFYQVSISGNQIIRIKNQVI